MEFYCERLEADVDLESCTDCNELEECKASGYFLEVTAQQKKRTFAISRAEDNATIPDPQHVSEIQKEEKIEEFNWMKWRWEFMRRDPEVQEVYKEILKLREKGRELTPENCPYPEIRAAYMNILDLKKQGEEIPPEVYDEFPSTWCAPYSFDADGKSRCFCYHCTPESKREREYCEKYGVTGSWFPDITRNFEEFSETIGTPASLILNRIFHLATVREPVKVLYVDTNQQKIVVEIDFSEINSLKKLKDDVLTKVQEYALKFGLSTKTQKRTSKDYMRILKVGDIKSDNPDLTRKDLAKHDDLGLLSEKNLETAVNAIGNALRDYQELTKNHGWKKILPI